MGQRIIVALLILYICPSAISPRSFSAWGQSSILDQVIKSQDAIVSIKSENSDVFSSPNQAVGINPKTGKVLFRRNVHAAVYNRAGAGVLIHSSGIIVTNAHTINRANRITVTFGDRQEAPAKVIRLINNLDFALLQVSLPYPIVPIELADSDKIQLGEEIITVGNSELLKQTVTGGKIIGIGTSRSDKQDDGQTTDLLQTTINLYSGDSGGPLFDTKGRLVGLMTAKETGADHSSFAIPSNKIRKYLKEYLENPKK
ncbi:MAG: trypsin-like peptidase domain-containing protein [Candidatus Omnitrophota bacterium]